MFLISNSPIQMQQFAKKLAIKFKEGGILALSGELGSGKTTFVQGFAKALGIKDKIISPTFVLIRQHRIPSTSWRTRHTLFHIDLYRLENKPNISELGIDEIISNPDNIIVIEWAEKILDYLPKKTIFINFEKISKNTRKILVNFPKNRM